MGTGNSLAPARPHTPARCRAKLEARTNGSAAVAARGRSRPAANECARFRQPMGGGVPAAIKRRLTLAAGRGGVLGSSRSSPERVSLEEGREGARPGGHQEGCGRRDCPLQEVGRSPHTALGLIDARWVHVAVPARARTVWRLLLGGGGRGPHPDLIFKAGPGPNGDEEGGDGHLRNPIPKILSRTLIR